MKTYTIYEPPEAAADRLDRAEALVFVKEGFNWVAAAFTPFWLLANKLWLALGAFIAAILLIRAGFWAFGINPRAMVYAFGAVQLIAGLESDSIKRWTLERNGWQQAGSVNGRDAEECERRFFDNWLPRQPLIRPEALSGSGKLASGASTPMSGPEPRRTGGWRSGRILGRAT